MSSSRFVFCQYCDDVRQEVDGKVTLVGVYQGGLQINDPLPAALPPLRLNCNLWTPNDRPLHKLVIKVLLGGKEVVSTEIPDQALADLAKTMEEARSKGDPGMLVNMVMAIQSVIVSEPSRLEVRVITEDDDLLSNPLEIRVPPKGAV